MTSSIWAVPKLLTRTYFADFGCIHRRIRRLMEDDVDVAQRSCDDLPDR